MLLGAQPSRPSDDVLLVPVITAERTGKHARPAKRNYISPRKCQRVGGKQPATLAVLGRTSGLRVGAGRRRGSLVPSRHRTCLGANPERL